MILDFCVFVSAKMSFLFSTSCLSRTKKHRFDEDSGFGSSKEQNMRREVSILMASSWFMFSEIQNEFLSETVYNTYVIRKLELTQRQAWRPTEMIETNLNPSFPILCLCELTCDFIWWLTVIKCFFHTPKVMTALTEHPAWTQILMWSLLCEADSCGWTLKWGRKL